MATTFLSDQLSAAPEAPNEVADVEGRLRLARWSYTFDGTEVAGDKVSLVKLPLNSRVVLLRYVIEQIDDTADGATTPTDIDIGDADDDDRYFTALGPDTGEIEGFYGLSGAAAQAVVEIDTENKRTIQATLDALDLTGGEQMYGWVFYTID